MSTTPGAKLSPDAFVARIHALGDARYHHRHPFHVLMHEGALSRGQIQAWALNRYYYQSRIPIKDALILAKVEDQEFRRQWRERIVDHDGGPGSEAGILKWLALADAAGLPRPLVESTAAVLPAVRFAVDAYIALVQRGSLLECVASSLTELFSPRLVTLRIGELRALYPWLSDALAYFDDRLTPDSRDAEFALRWVVENARTRDEQAMALGALNRKCDILWAQLDALYYAYVSPGHVPPGAYAP